jgi:AcrR family transcriptional regulator
MARPRDPTREADRRQAILKAAACAFARDGLQGTSIASICREAGISAGQLYYYYPSKESLIEAMAAADLEQMRAYAANLETLDDLLTAAIASTDPNHRDSHVKDKMLAGSLAFDLHAEAQRNPRIHAIIQSHFRDVAAIFGQRVAQAQLAGQVAAHHDPVRFARLVGAVREGLLTVSAVNPELMDDSMRAMVRQMLETAAQA